MPGMVRLRSGRHHAAGATPRQHLRLVPPHGLGSPVAPRPELTTAGALAFGVFLGWVAVMVWAAVAGWPLVVPMVAGGVLIAVWGAAGDLWHHRERL